MERFRNRVEAGRLLADALQRIELPAPVVLGLPRGGVPVAAPIALALAAPLDVLVVRKLGLPGQPELAIGAVGEQSARVLNDDIAAYVSSAELARIERRERVELDERVRRFRGERAPVDLAGRTALIVDDGIATGATTRVACLVAKARGAARVVVATPVAAPDSLAVLAAMPEVDQIVCLSVPTGFMAVGMHYLDFAQTSDAEVQEILEAVNANDTDER